MSRIILLIFVLLSILPIPALFTITGLVTSFKDLETFQSKEYVTSDAQELGETSAHLFGHLSVI